MWNLEELAAISSKFTVIEDFMQNFVIDPDQQTVEGLAEIISEMMEDPASGSAAVYQVRGANHRLDV